MTDPITGLPYGIDASTSVGQFPAPIDETGSQLTITAEDAAAVAALQPGSALLIVQRGTIAGERFLLNAAKVKAGRSTKADIFLDDVTVSRKHAEFLRDPSGTYVVRDLGSLNGTYVNRERIDAALLRSGDEVQIGKFRMSYQASPMLAGVVPPSGLTPINLDPPTTSIDIVPPPGPGSTVLMPRIPAAPAVAIANPPIITRL